MFYSIPWRLLIISLRFDDDDPLFPNSYLHLELVLTMCIYKR